MPQSGSASQESRSRPKLAEKKLPRGVTAIIDILSGKVKSLVTIIGIVKDVRAPISTRGTDWKSAITLCDKSTEDDGESLVLNIFRPEAEMPQPFLGDIVLVFSAKINMYGGSTSLITHRTTGITVFTASEIPRPPNPASAAAKPTRKGERVPSEEECEYISWLYHASDKDALPSAAEFETNLQRSHNVRDKFATLDNVKEHKFYDLIVQVVKDPFDQIDRVGLWVTDFSENESFFKFAWDGSDEHTGRDGDPFGYVAVNPNMAARGWPGPFGKRAMQLTCWEPHATAMRDRVTAGDWVRLRNVQIRFGKNGNNLEGFLREDRDPRESKVSVEVLDTTGTEHVDDRLKDAIRRKRDYEKAAKQQKKLLNDSKDGKRKADETPDDTKLNSKKRRAAKRAAKNKQLVEMENHKEKLLGLNELIRCESLDQPVFPLSTIVEPVSYLTDIDRQQVRLELPFTNAKYRAHVRVVDFRPRKLEDFAVWRKVTEYDMLSDNEGESELSSDEDETLESFVGKKTWEWRFSLQVEEAGLRAGKDGPPERLWALVSNTEAQLLLNMDACDLRAQPDVLSDMTEQLFKLWGNLEELKQQEFKAQIQSRRRLAANQAPPDSSDNEDEEGRRENNSKQAPGQLSNKPFTCCIRQYGIEVPESDPRKSNAGEGKRYERMFNLFGTKIK